MGHAHAAVIGYVGRAGLLLAEIGVEITGVFGSQSGMPFLRIGMPL